MCRCPGKTSVDQLIAESVMGSRPKIARFDYRRKVRLIPPQVKPKFMLSRSVIKILRVQKVASD